MTQDRTRDIAALLKRLAATPPPSSAETVPNGHALTLDHDEPLVGLFVRSFMLWEAGSARGCQAVKRLEQSLIDYNDLRVCLGPELVRIVGDRYPRADERCTRLKAALNDIYRREHRVSLRRLTDGGRREARQYLESLAGVPRYVASRVLLLGLEGHAAPVDGRILHRLVEAGIVEDGATPEDAAGMLEHSVRAGELLGAYTLLQAWADDGSNGEEAAGAKSPRPRVARPASSDPPASGPRKARSRPKDES